MEVEKTVLVNVETVWQTHRGYKILMYVNHLCVYTGRGLLSSNSPNGWGFELSFAFANICKLSGYF